MFLEVPERKNQGKLRKTKENWESLTPNFSKFWDQGVISRKFRDQGGNLNQDSFWNKFSSYYDESTRQCDETCVNRIPILKKYMPETKNVQAINSPVLVS